MANMQKERISTVLYWAHQFGFVRADIVSKFCMVHGEKGARAVRWLAKEGFLLDLGWAGCPINTPLAGRWFAATSKDPRGLSKRVDARVQRVAKVRENLSPAGAIGTKNGYYLPLHNAWVAVVCSWIYTDLWENGETRPWVCQLYGELHLRRRWRWAEQQPADLEKDVRTRVPDAVFEQKGIENLATGETVAVRKEEARSFRLEVELNIRRADYYEAAMKVRHDYRPVLFVTKDESDAIKLRAFLEGRPDVAVIRYKDVDGLRTFLKHIPLGVLESGFHPDR